MNRHTETAPSGCTHPVWRIIPEPEGSPHWGRRVCDRCGRMLRWEPHPDPVQRAARFRLFFGRHKGQRLGEVLALDRPYVEWLVDALAADERPGHRRVAELAAVLLRPDPAEVAR